MKKVKFISYDGTFPCLCMGKLIIKIGGKEISLRLLRRLCIMLFPKWHFKARIEQDNCEYGTYRVRFFIEGRVVGVNYYSAKNAELAHELLIVDVENFLGSYYDDFLNQ